MRICLLLTWMLLVSGVEGRAQNSESVFLITFDGLRWQEVYGGIEEVLMSDDRYVDDADELRRQFWAPSREERRAKLMPFLWSTIAAEGQLLGNRWAGNKVNVTNDHWFSYPGYNEILTGFADSRIDSNDAVPNPNETVLEWIHRQRGLNGRVAAFASWDVFPYIINEERSGIPVNAGFEAARHARLSPHEVFLNELLNEIPSRWETVRFDAFTHHYALEYIETYHPRVVYIAYGETDDFAHDGEYDQYIESAHQTDRWIRSLWEHVQRDPVYCGKTTFLITTDHGRGDEVKEEWTSHGTDVEGSDAIWIAAIGPDIPALGEHDSSAQYYQNQIAKTLAALLGLEYTNQREVGPMIEPFLAK